MHGRRGSAGGIAAPIGFSAGCLYRGGRAASSDPGTFDLYRMAGADALELMAYGDGSLAGMPADATRGFRWLSVHLAGGDGRPALAATLTEVSLLAWRTRVDCVVLHPCCFAADGAWDFSALAGCTLPFALENMDANKPTGRFPDELVEAFAECDAALGRRTGFVLDLSHVKQIDPTMSLAAELLDAFGDRLSEVHLSAHVTLHDELFATGQGEVVAAVPPGFPVILECGLEARENARREIEWVREKLRP